MLLRYNLGHRGSRALGEAADGYGALNRFRFAGDPDLFAAWLSASNVIGPRSAAKPADPEAPPSEGAVKPAA